MRYKPLTEIIGNANPVRWAVDHKARTAISLLNSQGPVHILDEKDVFLAFKVSTLITEYNFLKAPVIVDRFSEYLTTLDAEIQELLENGLVRNADSLVSDFIKLKSQPVNEFIKHNSPFAKCIGISNMIELRFVIENFPTYKFLKRYKDYFPDGPQQLLEIESLVDRRFPFTSKIGRWLV